MHKMLLSHIPKDILNIIAAYAIDNSYKLLDWIHIGKINWHRLSRNPNAIDLLIDNPDNINWYELSINPDAIDLLQTDKIDWNLLSGNPNAIDLLIANFDKIDWSVLSKNPNAIKLLKE